MSRSPTKPTYSIKDWDKHFENHESRKVKRSYWVPVPNRHDGKSFRRIAAHPEGVGVFAAWILILEAASKMPVRGVLADEDGPLDSDDLAAMTGFPSSIFESAFNLLTQEKFGWLLTGNCRARAVKSPGISRNLPESPGVTGNAAVEQKGTEQNRREDMSCSTAALVRSVFDFWKEHMGHPKAVLDSKREGVITARLKAGYSVDDLTAAIRGCKNTPYNMGDNPEHRVYDDIELICRDSKHVEGFMGRSSGQGPVAVPTIRERMGIQR